jgi:hypothetical protein
VEVFLLCRTLVLRFPLFPPSFFKKDNRFSQKQQKKFAIGISSQVGFLLRNIFVLFEGRFRLFSRLSTLVTKKTNNDTTTN